MKIVINTEFGGFGLSHKAIMRYAELKGKPNGKFKEQNISRDDPLLVQVVEEMGEDADGAYAQLGVVTIPEGVEWGIEESGGFEHVAEKHRTWYGK